MHEPIRIVVAEDNPGDAYLLEQALRREPQLCELRFFEDGEEAFRFLSRMEPYADAQRPDLIVLDLNLPKRDGWELLQFIRHDETLKSVPVAVISSAPADLAKQSLQQANRYIKKPMRLDEYMQIGRQILALL
ncbi:MAG: response regulator [Bryobacterales bacterium]|nr:response regulator [Bryobacterales bacterium]MBV9400170.1 response regulator [Bryobacterales bacterium]